MNRSLTKRLNALEQKFAALEPNAVILGIRAILDQGRGVALDGTDIETTRRNAISALRRSPHVSALSQHLLHNLETLSGSRTEASDKGDAP